MLTNNSNIYSAACLVKSSFEVYLYHKNKLMSRYTYVEGKQSKLEISYITNYDGRYVCLDLILGKFHITVYLFHDLSDLQMYNGEIFRSCKKNFAGIFAHFQTFIY